MKHANSRGLVVLLVSGSCLIFGASPAPAQSGPSNNGSIAATEYSEPRPSNTTPLVPEPEAGVLPGTDESEAPASGGPDAPSSNEPSGAEPAGAGAPDSGPENVTAREAGAQPAAADADAAGALPFTGGSALPIAAGGLVLLVAGAMLRRRALV
jgi:hypothetical protein